MNRRNRLAHAVTAAHATVDLDKLPPEVRALVEPHIVKNPSTNPVPEATIRRQQESADEYYARLDALKKKKEGQPFAPQYDPNDRLRWSGERFIKTLTFDSISDVQQVRDRWIDARAEFTMTMDSKGGPVTLRGTMKLRTQVFHLNRAKQDLQWDTGGTAPLGTVVQVASVDPPEAAKSISINRGEIKREIQMYLHNKKIPIPSELETLYKEKFFTKPGVGTTPGPR